MQIHVARKSTPIGVFPPEEIQQGLITGRFLLSDLAWRDGMATWTALGDWPEFRGVVPPAASAVPPGPAPDILPSMEPVGEVTVPWEREKSLGSFFETLKGAILTPQQTFAVGRYEFGTYVLFSYFAILLTLPFGVLNIYLAPDVNHEMAGILKMFNNPVLNQAAEQMMTQPPSPKWAMLIGYLVAAAIIPFLPALGGVFDWLAYRILFRKVGVQRTIVSSMIGVTLFNLLLSPLYLLASYPFVYYGAVALVAIPFMVIEFRARGAVLGLSGWWAFASRMLIIFIVGFCCACCAFTLISSALSAGALPGMR